MRLLLYLSAILFLFTSCTEERIRPVTSVPFITYSDEEYEVLSSALNLPNDVNDYDAGQSFLSSAHKGTLGRVLFYDKQLSEDNSVSCASCHDQSHAFADPAALSTGIYGRTTARNSIALGSFTAFNDEYGNTGGSSGAIFAGESKPLFWDMRAASVHDQMLETIANENEMGMALEDVVNRIQDQQHYEILFNKAFGSPQATKSGILEALQVFMLSIKAENTRLDRSLLERDEASVAFLMQHDLVYLTPEENHGMRLFLSNCASCHQSTLGGKVHRVSPQSEIFFANNGLDVVYEDKGHGEISGFETDNGVFKIPSLRNIELTYPYMHDGRFASLEDVIDFYSEGIQPHDNLDIRLRTTEGTPKKMNFDNTEKKALIAFLESLTDMTQMSHAKYADPWKR